MEFKKKLNYRAYRWLWVMSGRLSRWAGRKIIAIVHQEEDACKRREEEEARKCQR